MIRPRIAHPWIAAAIWMAGILLLIPAGRPFLKVATLALGRHGVMATGFLFGFFLLAGLGRMLVDALDGLTPVRIFSALAVIGLYGVGILFIAHPEELSHPLEYTPLALLLEQALATRLSPWPRAILAMALIGLAGMADEGLQRLMPGRVADWNDVLLDFLGGVLPLVYLRIIERQ